MPTRNKSTIKPLFVQLWKEVGPMKKKETEFLTEEEAQAILRVPDRRTLQSKRIKKSRNV
jgi:hypothetical protein